MFHISISATKFLLYSGLFFLPIGFTQSVFAEERQDLSVKTFDRASSLQQQANALENRELLIKLSDRRVYLLQNNRLVTSYPIAIGKPGWETPTGQFQVTQMLKNPTWQHPWKGTIIPPGKENPLGDRWIAFWSDGTNFIGFHGTPNEKTVGTPASHGCIRMKNRDIRKLFEQVAVGTSVLVEK